MKKEVLLFLIIILLVNLVSAAYDCSGTVSTEEDLISVGQIEYINGVRVALIYSSAVGVAEMLIDVMELILTSGSPYGNVTFVSGVHEFNLTSVSSSFVSMKVDEEDVEEIEKNKIKTVGDVQIYVSHLEGVYPGDYANIQFFAGDEYLSFYSPNSPSNILTIGAFEYFFGVSSLSNSEAMIEVSRCDGGNFVEIDEPVEQEGSEVNDSSSQNEDVQDEPLIEDENIGNEELQEKSFLQKLYIPVIIIVVIIAISIVFFILYRTYKKYKGTVSENRDVSKSV